MVLPKYRNETNYDSNKKEKSWTQLQDFKF